MKQSNITDCMKALRVGLDSMHKDNLNEMRLELIFSRNRLSVLQRALLSGETASEEGLEADLVEALNLELVLYEARLSSQMGSMFGYNPEISLEPVGMKKDGALQR